MAKAVRRQTPQQRIATIFGGVILLALIVFAIGSVIQGSRRPDSDSAMQRVLSSRVAPYHFVSDRAWVEGDTVFVHGHYAGVPKDLPASDEEWQGLIENVAKAYAADLRGVANSVDVSMYHLAELRADRKSVV